jgi:NRPS condensation-like uncharacterized protein
MVHSTPKSTKLNLFQQVMVLWEEVCPYNAACVVHLRGRAEFTALREAIQESCRLSGVGKLLLNGDRKTYYYEPVDTIPLDQIQRGDSIMETLCQVVTERINTPFPSRPHHPIRWAVLDDSHTNTHFFLIVWRHLAADAVSMFLLLRCVLARYYGVTQTFSHHALEVHPPDYLRVMKPHYRQLGYTRTLLRSIRLYFRLRRVYRLPELTERREGSRVLFFDAPADLIHRLIGACRTRHVTVNDSFLAALGSALAAITPSRQTQQRRNRLALATAVDIRHVAAEDLSDCFGLFARYWVTMIGNPDLSDFEGMLHDVTRQTRLEKAEQRFVGPEWDFLTLLLLHRWFSVNEDRSWYRKVYPLSAGLSNIRMSAASFPAGKERILGCFLVPSTGPALPLVVTLATLDDELKLGVAYQEASLSESQVRTVIELFLLGLDQFCKTSKAESY